MTKVKELIEKIGYDIREDKHRRNNKINWQRRMKMKAATLQLETLTCPSCTQKIEGALKSLEGIEQDTAKILFNSSKVKLDFDEDKVSIEEIENAIIRLGYDVLKTRVK